MTIIVESVPNPAIREGDLVDVELDELNASGVYRVIEYRLPVHVDGLMSMTLRQVYDPALNYRPPGDRGDGCLVSFSDTFERPDQNLEHKDPGEVGSPDWTEFGWSWGVVGGRAIQRYRDSWSFGMVNTPLCASNQYAETQLAVVPAGRPVGPGVRSTGEFDGYFALADSTGRISLELWLNGARMMQLGSYQHSGTLVGSTLRLRAVGPALTVLVNGASVLTASDDRCVGSHVGMLAYGDWTGSSPAVESFSAGAA
jgi:hypothetical protein